MNASLDRKTVLNAAGALVVVLIAAPFVAHAFPQAIGASSSYVVLSGSMEPTIETGGVIFVYERPPEQIEEGDIVTFDLDGSGNEVTTHRVVEVTERNGQRVFITKGDANEDPDRAPVPPDAVIGVVPQVFGAYLAVPFVGRALLFAQSDQGIIALVFVPAGLLIVSEVWDLYRHATSGASEDETVADGSGDEDVAESERDDSAAGSGSDEVFDVAAAGDPAEAADGTAAAGSAANGTVPDDTGPESESEEVTDQ